MSKDFQIAFPCPHVAIAEPVSLASDKVTLVTSIGAVAVGQVTMNGKNCPPEGLLTRATITTANRAPFRIYSDATDLVVTLHGLQYTFTLTPGQNGLAELVEKLDKHQYLQVEATTNGQLKFTDLSAEGPGSRLLISGGAATALGLDRQRGATGREICPPWTVASKTGGAARPQFLYPPKMVNARWEVTYTMDPNACRRCMASRVENDLRFRASNGEPSLIGDENLLYQTVMKALLTMRGSNPYHPWYGTRIASMIGSKGSQAASGIVKSEIDQRMKELISIQGTQAKYQAMSMRERISEITRLDVLPHKDDPTTLLVKMSVRNQARKSVAISMVFATPGTVGTVLKDGRVINRLGTK